MIGRIDNSNTHFEVTAAKFSFDVCLSKHCLKQANQHTLRPKVWTDCIIEKEEYKRKDEELEIAFKGNNFKPSAGGDVTFEFFSLTSAILTQFNPQLELEEGHGSAHFHFYRANGSKIALKRESRVKGSYKSSFLI